jgi:hypothetical protein
VAGEHVFVSYAHADIDYVRRLVDFLRGEGVAVWFDEHIPTSQRWDLELEHRIDTCRAMLVVMSSAARGSHWVGVELDHARRQNRPIFPLLLDGKPLFGVGVLQYESVAGGRLPQRFLCSSCAIVRERVVHHPNTSAALRTDLLTAGACPRCLSGPCPSFQVFRRRLHIASR